MATLCNNRDSIDIILYWFLYLWHCKDFFVMFCIPVLMNKLSEQGSQIMFLSRKVESQTSWHILCHSLQKHPISFRYKCCFGFEKLSLAVNMIGIHSDKGLTLETSAFLSLCIVNSMICSDIWHKYHKWYFKIIVLHNFTSR